MSQNFTNIHPDAQLGENVTVDSFTTIHEDVVIGDGTWVGSNVTIFPGARIGKNCKIFPGAVISGVPQDLKFDGEYTTTQIGDNTTIREFVTISRGTSDKETTAVGSNCLIMAYAHIAHDCIIGDHVIIGNTTQIAGHAIVDDWAIISGGSLVHQFARIGCHVMIGGGSRIRKDVPPYVKAGREPLAYLGVNSVGLKRRGFENDQINQIMDVFRVVYTSGLPMSKAVEEAAGQLPSTVEVNKVLDFFRSSERGVIKGYSSVSTVKE